MKKAILLFIATTVLYAACERNDDSKRIYCFGAGYIKYEATIGCDFESALDSLLKVIVFRPNEPYIVVPEPLDVVYPTNDRDFYWIAFKDTADRLYMGSPMDVLDTKGDWYRILWGDD